MRQQPIPRGRTILAAIAVLAWSVSASAQTGQSPAERPAIQLPSSETSETPRRLTVDEVLMAEIAAVSAAVRPIETLLVVDAMTMNFS